MSQKTYAAVINPHDQFFRKAMEDKRVATEFLKLYLPADLCAQIDFNVLSLQPRAHANAVRKWIVSFLQYAYEKVLKCTTELDAYCKKDPLD